MKSFTLNESVNIEGIGLHTGVKTNVILNPAPLNSGIFFNRIDRSTIIPAKWDNVISTKFSTNIASNGVEVKTVEHLLSALAGLHINNCEILIDNVEVPILDGSSNEFVESILNKGIKESKNLKLEIQNHVKKKIAPYKYPRSIIFTHNLPKTKTGKIQRYKLKEN